MHSRATGGNGKRNRGAKSWGEISGRGFRIWKCTHRPRGNEGEIGSEIGAKSRVADYGSGNAFTGHGATGGDIGSEIGGRNLGSRISDLEMHSLAMGGNMGQPGAKSGGEIGGRNRRNHGAAEYGSGNELTRPLRNSPGLWPRACWISCLRSWGRYMIPPRAKRTPPWGGSAE